jgi:hypothetical protein
MVGEAMQSFFKTESIKFCDNQLVLEFSKHKSVKRFMSYKYKSNLNSF